MSKSKNKQKRGKTVTEFQKFERVMAKLDYQIKQEEAQRKKFRHDIEQGNNIDDDIIEY